MAVKLALRTKKVVQQFRRIPNGGTFYKNADSTGPFVKASSTQILASGTLPIGSGHALTTVADVSTKEIRISKFSLRSQNAI